MKLVNIRRLIYPLLLVLGLILSAAPGSADAAERAWPIITFTCDKENTQLKIKNEVKWGEAGKSFPFSAAQGTYNPWSLVKSDDRGERVLLSESDKLKLSCRLLATEYRVVVRPKIFNVNFKGKCGDSLSVIVSIYANSELILDEKPLEAFCNGNAPVVRGIKIDGMSGKLKIYEVPRSRFY